jgi:N-acetylglucosamine repressor
LAAVCMRKIDTGNFTLATRATARAVNRQIALNLVREHQPISRADLARRMNVDRATVTSLINGLIDEGLVREGKPVDAPRGRRPRMLYTRTRDRLVVACDVRFGRSYILLSDLGGTQLALETFATPATPEELIDELARRAERLVSSHLDVGECSGIGLVVPGVLDRETGRLLYSVQLGWRDVELRDALAERTGLPVAIENAPIACTLAQMWFARPGAAADDFVYVTVSEGVGSGIVVNRQLVRGRGNNAGEFGHIVIDPAGPRCLCGGTGCWEAHVSNLATLSRYFGHELSAAGTRALLDETSLTINDLVLRARTGDRAARAALEATGGYLGEGLVMIINALNPHRIIIGGEITAGWDIVEPRLRAVIEARALTPSAASTPVIPEHPGDYPRLRGAVALVAAPLFAAPEVA